jgi:hypothetical protein
VDTVPSAVGRQAASSAPLASENAASRFRGASSTPVNWPPAYSRADDACSARTRPLARWFQASRAPLVAPTAARRPLAAPPTAEKSPPR